MMCRAVSSLYTSAFNRAKFSASIIGWASRLSLAMWCLFFVFETLVHVCLADHIHSLVKLAGGRNPKAVLL